MDISKFVVSEETIGLCFSMFSNFSTKTDDQVLLIILLKATEASPQI